MWEPLKLFTTSTLATLEDFVVRHPREFCFRSAGKRERVFFFCHSISRPGLDQCLHQRVLVHSHTIPDDMNLPRNEGAALAPTLPKCLSQPKSLSLKMGHIQALNGLHSQGTFTSQERPPPIFGMWLHCAQLKWGENNLNSGTLFHVSLQQATCKFLQGIYGGQYSCISVC